MIRSLTPAALDAWLRDGARPPPVLLDVREAWEYARVHLPGSMHLPMAELPERATELDARAAHVVICHHGLRSLQVARHLERLGFADLHNLSGGIDAWAREIDPGMPRY